MNLLHAAAHLYFTKASLVSHLVHQVKYNRQKELGIQLGCFMGDALKNSSRFHPDLLVPVPLFPDRERKRGYNQSLLLCEGISEHIRVPIQKNVISRALHTDTQTRKGRIERWKNIEGKFTIMSPELVRDKHVLLVDDVITTGATLESCGNELLKVEKLKLSIACLCHAFS
jgi:ComF family protein